MLRICCYCCYPPISGKITYCTYRVFVLSSFIMYYSIRYCRDSG